MQTTVIKEREHYIINGSKMWITNGSIADVAIVWAKTKKDDLKSIKGFFVEKGAPGFTATCVEDREYDGQWCLETLSCLTCENEQC